MDWTPERIKALRTRFKLNQTEMADAMGYSTQARVSDLERGSREPSSTTARLLDYMDTFGLLPTWRSPDADVLRDHTLIVTQETGQRAIYEHDRDRLWIDLGSASKGILLSAMADSAAISVYGGLFALESWLIEQHEPMREVVDTIRRRIKDEPATSTDADTAH